MTGQELLDKRNMINAARSLTNHPELAAHLVNSSLEKTATIIDLTA